MLNKDKWFNNYANLSPESQLEIADKIVEELKLNEYSFDPNEYDIERSKMLRGFIKDLYLKLKDKSKLNNVASVIERFNKLNSKNQMKVIDSVYQDFVKSLDKVELIQLQNRCKNKGHHYGKWEHIKWNTYSDIYIDHMFVKDYPTKHECWERKCSLCGFVQSVKKKPRDLVKIEKEASKKAEIKKLEKRLEELKRK